MWAERDRERETERETERQRETETETETERIKRNVRGMSMHAKATKDQGPADTKLSSSFGGVCEKKNW